MFGPHILFPLFLLCRAYVQCVASYIHSLLFCPLFFFDTHTHCSAAVLLLWVLPSSRSSLHTTVPPNQNPKNPLLVFLVIATLASRYTCVRGSPTMWLLESASVLAQGLTREEPRPTTSSPPVASWTCCAGSKKTAGAVAPADYKCHAIALR